MYSSPAIHVEINSQMFESSCEEVRGAIFAWPIPLHLCPVVNVAKPLRIF
jgi:hypothetical protein